MVLPRMLRPRPRAASAVYWILSLGHGPTGTAPADRRMSKGGGDTASTGIGEHGMHAEHHRLVNPMENTITANDTQLALAA